jgi:DNA-binding NarL/FixJ family response regulator
LKSSGRRTRQKASFLHTSFILPSYLLHACRLPVLNLISLYIPLRIYATGCIAISTFDSEYLIAEAIEAGAKGYIVKNAQKNEIMDAIHSVYNNCPYYCRTVTAMLTKKISLAGANPNQQWTKKVVSEREKEIIRLVCREETSEEIGKKLFMSKKNVDFLRGKIMKKLNVQTMIGLVIYAVKNEIFINED